MNPRPIETWEQAEELAVAFMRRSGFRDARATGGSADGGIDVRSSGGLAQVKKYNKPVPSSAVRDLVGARRRDHHMLLLFFAARGPGYARPAREFAQEMGVALFTYDIWGTVRPVNSHARRIVDAARGEGGSQPVAPAVRGGSEPVRVGGGEMLLSIALGISIASTVLVAAVLMTALLVAEEAPPAGAFVLLAALGSVALVLLLWWGAGKKRGSSGLLQGSPPRVGSTNDDDR